VEDKDLYFHLASIFYSQSFITRGADVETWSPVSRIWQSASDNLINKQLYIHTKPK
jgi:hypothetical protein